jgi:outer membrane protein TolC
MIVPTREMLPDLAQIRAIAPVEQLAALPTSEVIQNRPELQTFKLALERANNRVALRQNDLQPSLNASVELSRDFGRSGRAGRALIRPIPWWA